MFNYAKFDASLMTGGDSVQVCHSAEGLDSAVPAAPYESRRQVAHLPAGEERASVVLPSDRRAAPTLPRLRRVGRGLSYTGGPPQDLHGPDQSAQDLQPSGPLLGRH